MAPLAQAALDAVRTEARLSDEARCRAQDSTVPPRAFPKELAGVAYALRCAVLTGDRGAMSADALADTAIAAMAAKLDKETRYLTAERTRRLATGSKGMSSVGLTLESRRDGFFVVGTHSAAPAELAGLREGDKLIAVDGVSAADLSFSEVIDRLRGAEGSSVSLTVQPGAGPARTVILSRKMISALESALDTERRGTALILHIQSMPDGIAEAVKARISSEGQSLRTVIIDLRNNSGGRLDQAIELADLFLDKGVIVTSRGRSERDAETYRARKGQMVPGVPIIVVVSHRTASGAEIVVSALQDNHRAIVVGEKTAGAGSVQTLMPLGAGYFLSFTTSFEYRPSGEMLIDAPVIPDCPSNAPPIAQLDLAVELGAKGLAACPQPLGS